VKTLRFQVAYGERKAANGDQGEFVPQFVESGQVAVFDFDPASLRAGHLEIERMFSEALLRVVAHIEAGK
jgi:hypothetical protein